MEIEQARFAGERGPSALQRLWPEAPSPLPELEAYLREAETQAELEACERERRYPRAVLDGLHTRGLFRLLADASGEPSEITSRSFALLNAMTAREGGTGLAISVGVNVLALLPSYVAADEAQLAETFAKVRAGARCAMLLTEAKHGSNLLRIETRAERGVLDGDAFVPVVDGEPCTHYRVTGEKHTINGGREHELLFTLVRTRGKSGAGGLRAMGDLSVLRVERGPGVRGLEPWQTLPARASDISGVAFDGVVVPASHLIGDEGSGFQVVRSTLTLSRGGIAPLASGTLSRARDLARAYAARRDVTGTPIATLKGIGDHLLKLEALDRAVAAVSARAMAAMNAVGRRAAHLTAVAKLMACALAEEGVNEGARVVSGRALLEELPYTRLVRDVRLYGVFDGTRHVVLGELEARLADDAYRWNKGVAPPDTLAAARALHTAPTRPFLEVAREGGSPLVLSPPEHLAALSALPGCEAGPVARVADGLYRVVAGLFAANAWKEDQGNRFHAAETLGLLETVAALLELYDPACREALGLDPLPGDDADWARWARAWLAARAAARVRELAARAGCAHGLDHAEQELLTEVTALRGELLDRLAAPGRG